jgi:hypothetical protein
MARSEQGKIPLAERTVAHAAQPMVKISMADAGAAGVPGSATATAQAPGVPATTQPPSTPAQTAGLPAGYLPLFPFTSLADVHAWQASYQSGGHQPWHRSPDLTATAFAAFLGYTDVTQVVQSAVSGGDAHVAVGIKLPDGTISTAAIIHLVLSGSGTYAPWEVVGTEDRTFTVDRPAYGSTARSPVTAGGTITGWMRTSGSRCTPCPRRNRWAPTAASRPAAPAARGRPA